MASAAAGMVADAGWAAPWPTWGSLDWFGLVWIATTCVRLEAPFRKEAGSLWPSSRD